MRRGKSYHLNSTCDIGEPDLPGPDRGKRGAMWREPLTGNMGEDLEPHKPVHETTTGSWTSKNGNEGGRPTSSLSLPASHGWCHLHFRERGSPMKNRKREICTSGSVRDEDGQPPHLLGRPRQHAGRASRFGERQGLFPLSGTRLTCMRLFFWRGVRRWGTWE